MSKEIIEIKGVRLEIDLNKLCAERNIIANRFLKYFSVTNSIGVEPEKTQQPAQATMPCEEMVSAEYIEDITDCDKTKP